MRISVAICTWNRCDSLRRTLQSLAAADPPRSATLEVVVVDNNSTDDTARVVHDFSERLPIVAVHEPQPGLSNARNAAVAHTTGDYVLWTDDDVVVSCDWLRGYEDAVAAHPEAAFFGGPIQPVFEGGRPAWLESAWNDVAGAFAERELGAAPFRFDSRTLPFGANMAIRAAELKQHRFDPTLGRQPGPLWLAGDETALLRDLLARGLEGWWVPASRVQHVIPPERQTTAYLRDYFEGLGRTNAHLKPRPVGRPVLGRPLWLWRHGLQYEAVYRWLRMTSGAERWVPALVRAATVRGLLKGLR